VAAGVLDIGGRVVVVLTVVVVGAGAGGGTCGEHAVTAKARTAPAVVARRRIRPASQNRSVRAETTRSSDTVLGPLGLGY
jgi:hypothetical protein